jgi:hypothetical protein
MIRTSSTSIKWNLSAKEKVSVSCGSIIGRFHCIINCMAVNTCSLPGFSLKFLQKKSFDFESIVHICR